MKIAIIYRSMTGHSKKIARAIANAFEVEAQNVKKKPSLENINLLFIVGGIYSRKSLPEMLDYVKTLSNKTAQKVVLITSSAMDKAGQDDVRKILTANEIEVLGEYRCRGNFLFIKMGHPNKKEIQGAVDFARSFTI